MRSTRIYLILALWLAALALQAQTRTVLILHSYHLGYVWDASIHQGMVNELRNRPDVTVQTEYLDTLNHNSPEYLESFARHLALKYRTAQFDVLLVSDDNAMNFLNARPELFPEVPIVFCGINNYQNGQFPNRPLLTGVTEAISATETLQLALAFRPEAKRILAVADTIQSSRKNFQAFEDAVAKLGIEASHRIIRAQGATLQELASYLSELTEKDMVVYLSYLNTPDGKAMSVKEIMSYLKANTPAAIFGMWDFLLPEGALGGHIVHGYSQGQTAASLAIRVLDGVPIKQIPVIMTSPNQYAVNDSMLKHFGIPNTLVPDNSILYAISDQTFISQWHGEGRKSAFGYDLFEAHSMQMLLIDPEAGTIVDANRAARLFYGYRELVGMNIGSINTLDAAAVAAEMEKARQQERDFFQFRHRLADGSIRDVAVYSGPVKLNEKDLLFSIVQDISGQIRQEELVASQNRFFRTSLLFLLLLAAITIVILWLTLRGRRRLEAAVRASEQKLSSLFEAMQELVVMHQLVFDAKGKAVNYRITDCNRAYTESTGLSREAAVGKLATEAYGTAEAPYLQQYSEVATSGRSLQMEVYFPPMDKHFKISVVATGKNQFATVTSDITDLKRIQQSIATKNRELEQIIYVTSHDLRSPLVNVDGYGRELEFALADIEAAIGPESSEGSSLHAVIKSSLPEMADALHHIRSSTKQMDNLLKGLLKLSRSGRAALNIIKLDMNEALAKTIASFDFQAKECGAQISCGKLPACRADPVQIDQIFSNLISNAIKYRERSRNCQIAIEGYIEHGQAVYCISDNGIGIAPEHQENIFELFHRLDPSAHEGEGLGLTIVRQVVSRLGGNIRVESEPGTGSKFYVSLPSV